VGAGLTRAASDSSFISVVVVAYHSGPALRRCLRALREDAPEAGVIVVDNGGADGEVVEQERWDRLRLVEPGANLGFAAGANLGAAKTADDVLVFLNPDTVIGPGALRQLSRTLEDPTIGIAMARLRLLDRPELLNSGGTVLHVSGLAWAGRFGEPAESIRSVENVAAASGAALAIRRETFNALGGFTDELFMYHEDVELSWRAHLAGLRVVVDPCADVFHEYEFGRHPSKIALLERNRLVFVLTSYSLRLLLLLGPLLALGELAMLVLAVRQRWFRGKLDGWWWCLRNAPWLVRHRRETKRLRRVRDRDLAHFLTPGLDPGMTPLPRGTASLNRLLGPYWSLVRKAL
jgi:GT2 family glycosyltransferase